MCILAPSLTPAGSCTAVPTWGETEAQAGHWRHPEGQGQWCQAAGRGVQRRHPRVGPSEQGGPRLHVALALLPLVHPRGMCPPTSLSCPSCPERKPAQIWLRSPGGSPRAAGAWGLGQGYYLCQGRAHTRCDGLGRQVGMGLCPTWVWSGLRCVRAGARAAAI